MERNRKNHGSDNNNNNDEDNAVVSDDGSVMDLIIPNNVRMTSSEHQSTEQFLKLLNCDDCITTSMKTIPFELKKRSRSCQICQYELKLPKWKDVVFCSKHGVRLCLTISPPRELATPPLVKVDGSDVTDFSWTCQKQASCGDKFHQFYLPNGLYNESNIDLNQRKIKFGSVQFLSELHQKKYEALRVEVKRKESFLRESDVLCLVVT
jgi:hypothetical protein